MNQEKIRLGDCAEGDEVGVAQLLHDNFPNAFEAERIQKTWRWQFRNDFSKNGGVAIAKREQEIVAQYAVMWLPMVYKGQKIDGAISTATVTDKSVRGQGLFTKLAVKVYQDIAIAGAKIVYGFPNSQSINGFIKRLEWFEVANFPIHIKPVDAYTFIRKIIGDKGIARLLIGGGNIFLRLIFDTFLHRHGQTGIGFIQVKDIPDDIDHLWETTSVKHKIALVRNKKYLTWRYLEKPFFSYDIYMAITNDDKLCGCLITHTAERFGIKIIFVMELIAERDDPAVCQVLLDKLRHKARMEGAGAISILILPGNPNHKLYLRNGYLPVPRRLFPQDIFFGARVNSPDIDPVYIKDQENWYISWGDLDVV